MAINLERFVKAKRFTEDHVLDDASDQILVKVATDSVAGKVALNAGTSLPGDATNCTDALTACGLNALLTDPAAGGNAVINNVKALIPLATTTIPGLIEEATGEETRLGATDANRADRAVTPGSMSYALQGGRDYPINVATDSVFTGYFGNISTTQAGRIGALGKVRNTTGAASAARGVWGNIEAGTVSSANGSAAGYFDVSATVSVDAATPIFSAVNGTNLASASVATTQKLGAVGISEGTGGTNIGVYGRANIGATNWAGYFDGNVAGGAYTTLSDATLKENVEAIDAAKALQFRNGLRWVTYEMFTEQHEQITETVVDGEGNETQVPTGRYEVKRNSLGKKRGLIAQEVQALAASIGDFSDVVQVVGEYFTLDAQGYPVKDAQGKNIVNKRLGLDYDAVSFIVMCAEQSLLIPA